MQLFEVTRFPQLFPASQGATRAHQELLALAETVKFYPEQVFLSF